MNDVQRRSATISDDQRRSAMMSSPPPHSRCPSPPGRRRSGRKAADSSSSSTTIAGPPANACARVFTRATRLAPPVAFNKATRSISRGPVALAIRRFVDSRGPARREDRPQRHPRDSDFSRTRTWQQIIAPLIPSPGSG
jgi:hypothetical protein